MKDIQRVAWRKSSYSDQSGGECVELADLAPVVGVRDSKNPHGPALRLTRTAATTLAAGIKSGTLDL